MNIRNAFDNSDETTIERITTEYPLLDADEKERLYAMSKEKYNSDIKNNKNNGTEVSGVERYRKPLWHKVLSAVAAAVVVIGGVGGGVLLLGKGGGVDPMTDIEGTEISEEENQYEVNENGQTYGSNPDATSLEELPDLVAVLGDNGNEGYIYAADFWSAVLSSPEEALAMQESYAPRVFDVYESDGVTVIDTFTEGDRTVQNESEQAEYDYTAIAQQLFDDYLEGERIVCYGDVSYDENDSITFYTYASDDAEWSEKYGGERTFYKVTDERFNNGQDIYEMMKTITTTNNAIRFDNNTSLIGRFVSDVSMFEIGSDVDLNDVDAERQVAAYGINLDVYIEYNGKLYVRPRPYEIEYTTEVKVIETSENGFTASRYMKMPYHNANIQYGEEVILEIVQENGEWKINYMESGIDVEYNASIAIQVYFEDDPDFYDLSIDPSDIIKNMEVLEYDDEIKRCKVHTIMIDVNGEEAVDFTGEIMLTKQSDEAIADAQVTRLNEYDGTLKRPSVLWAEQQGTLEN
ncbi:MAG: hypothetical protein IKJ87_08195 [Ruminococcus sp.]|nr:hypothetical protein [Ruminococcus sp.]